MSDSNIQTPSNLKTPKDYCEKQIQTSNGNKSEYTQVDPYKYIKQHPKYTPTGQRIQCRCCRQVTDTFFKKQFGCLGLTMVIICLPFICCLYKQLCDQNNLQDHYKCTKCGYSKIIK